MTLANGAFLRADSATAFVQSATRTARDSEGPTVPPPPTGELLFEFRQAAGSDFFDMVPTCVGSNPTASGFPPASSIQVWRQAPGSVVGAAFLAPTDSFVNPAAPTVPVAQVGNRVCVENDGAWYSTGSFPGAPDVAYFGIFFQQALNRYLVRWVYDTQTPGFNGLPPRIVRF